MSDLVLPLLLALAASPLLTAVVKHWLEHRAKRRDDRDERERTLLEDLAGTFAELVDHGPGPADLEEGREWWQTRWRLVQQAADRYNRIASRALRIRLDHIKHLEYLPDACRLAGVKLGHEEFVLRADLADDARAAIAHTLRGDRPAPVTEGARRAVLFCDRARRSDLGHRYPRWPRASDLDQAEPFRTRPHRRLGDWGR